MGNTGGNCLKSGLLLAKAAVMTADVQDSGGAVGILDFLPQSFAFSFIQVNTAHLCLSEDDSQVCFSDQITPRDVVKKQKHVRPWKLFKEMSKRLSVAGTLNSKPKIGGVGGLYCILGTVDLLSSFSQGASLPQTPAWFYHLYSSDIRSIILALVSHQLIHILKLVHFLEPCHCWTRQVCASTVLMGPRG